MNEQKQILLTIATETAERVGWHAMLRKDVAKAANCATGLVSHHFGTMGKLRKEVMREAVRTEKLRVVAEGLSIRHPAAVAAGKALRVAAAATIVGR